MKRNSLLLLVLMVIITSLSPTVFLSPSVAASSISQEWEVANVIHLDGMSYANGIAINHDDSVLYVNGRAGAVLAMDTADFNIFARTQLPVNQGYDSLGETYLLPDESAIVEIDEAGSIFFLDPNTLQEIPPRLHPGSSKYAWAFTMDITDDSQLGITAGTYGGGPGYVRFYNLQDHELLYSLNMGGRQYIHMVGITPDETRAYVFSFNSGGVWTSPIFVIDIASRQIISTMPGLYAMGDIEMDPIRDWAYVGSDEGIGVYDVATDSFMTVWDVGDVNKLTYDSVNDILIATTLTSWNFISPDTGEILQTLTYPGATYLRYSVVSHDGKRIYTTDVLNNNLYVLEVINQPPDCANAVSSKESIWPANHKFVAVDILGVTDPDGDIPIISIESIYQDEPVEDTGDGGFAPDGQGVGTSQAEVRAERNGAGNGRVYHIGFTASDDHGGTCSGTVLVSVPKSQNKKNVVIDDGTLYDSLMMP